jgi:hypothetical protein
MSGGSTVPPEGTSGCSPDVEIATPGEFRLVNRTKPSNFIWGELTSGVLAFIVENRPKDGTGCPGKWTFDQMMRHFGDNVTAIRGCWTYGDNLATVNTLTTGAAIAVEDAARWTWTGKRAAEWGYTQIQLVGATGQPGAFVNVQVLFRK